MTPEVEADLRTTVASLRVKASCIELLFLALLPTLQHHQKEAIRECLDMMEQSEVPSSRLTDQGEVERRQHDGSSQCARRWMVELLWMALAD
jgi:hypothetical protein